MYVPFQAVSDGGNISAFYAKVAYTPAEISNIQWHASMVWIVQAKLDQYVNCNDADHPSAATCSIDTQTEPIQTYDETFRITGLHITKSENVETAIFGTPLSPNEDQQLFNLTFGMSASYLSNQNPTLEDVVQRFHDDSTSIEERWGVTTEVASNYATYPHADVGWATTTMTDTAAFLSANYQSTDNPSLLFAMQQDIGAFNMDDLGTQPATSISVSMDNIHTLTQRGLKLATFGHDSEWSALSTNDTLDVMQERYPDMTSEDLFYVNFFYPTWQTGKTEIIAVDGVGIVSEEAEDKEIFETLGIELSKTVHEYMEEIEKLGDIYFEITQGEGAVGALWNWIKTLEDSDAIVLTTVTLGAFFGIIALVLIVALDSDRIVEDFEQFLGGLGVALAIFAAGNAIYEVQEAGQGLEGLFTAIEMSKWVQGFVYVGLVVQLAFIWGFFGYFASTHSGVVVDIALALAIAQTLIAILFFALVFFPGGKLLLATFVLISWIVKLSTGFGINEWLTVELSKLFVDVKTLTTIPDDGINLTTGGALLSTPDAGSVIGNQFAITSTFSSQLITVHSGDGEDLKDSSIQGRWEGSAPDGQATANAYTYPSTCITADSEKNCVQELEMRWTLDEAQRNLGLELLTLVDYTIRVKECVLFSSCSAKSISDASPSEDDKEAREKSTDTLYLDVLPGTLEELWNWDQINNYDLDGDGLANDAEISLGTEPKLWDSDGDGLSDAYEVQNQDTLGYDPLLWDTDDDGLSDWEESGLGSNAGQEDTDGDGLLDGQEWFHQNQDGDWSGGWKVSLFEGTSILTISDPSLADGDNDGLLDLAERDGKSSPWASNVAPALLTVASPQATAPDGASSVYVKPGDTVSWFMTVLNDSNEVITTTLTTCLPNTLTNLQGGQLAGDVLAPLQIGTCAGGVQYAWPFTSPEQLGLGLQVTTTVTATVDSRLTTSVAVPISTTLPYSNTTLVRSDNIHVDAEKPVVIFTAPVDGDVLRGDSYVVGGTATDLSSWITQVQLDLDNGQGFQSTTDTNPWSATWSLPDDGVYNLKAQASDYLGWINDITQVAVTVDNTPPTASFAASGGDYIPNLDPDDSGGAVVTLEGSASDNLSGLARVQVSIDRKPWQQATLGTSSDYPTQSDWTYDWQVLTSSAQGSHDISVRAWDLAGNVSETSSQTLILDILPPSDMWSNHQSALIAEQTFTLWGHADDTGNLPLPSRPQDLIGAELDAYSSATIWLEPPSPLITDGMVAAWLGDVDGDSRADLAVGLPASENNTGRVAIIYGQGGGWPVAPDATALSSSPSSFVGADQAAIGSTIAPAGDVNGDGLSDLLIGDSANQRAFLVFGKTGDIGSDRTLDGPSQHDWVVLTTSDSLRIGDWLASAGDVDGDGYGDLLIGAVNTSGDEGVVYLLRGQAPTWDATLDLATAAAASFPLPSNGAPATGVGDMDSDGYDDFIIADPNNDLDEGAAVYLYLGDMILPTSPVASFLGDSGATVGAQVSALGDVNGDSLPDVAYSSGNTPRIVYGRTSGWSMNMPADVAFDGYTPVPNAFIAAPGDVDVDGLNDILLGATGGGGRAYLVLGSSDLATNQPVQAQIANVGSAASAPYAAGADLNCDLSSDLLLVPLSQEATQFHRSELDLGAAVRPRALHELPVSGEYAATQPFDAQALSGGDESLTTSALAFRIYENDIDDWITDTVLVADFDGDGLSDVAGWDSSIWRTWHSDGLSGDQLSFSEYDNNLSSSMTGGAARFQGDFDGDGLDDLATWGSSSSSSWQFVRAHGASGTTFDFATVEGNLGDLTGGDTDQMVVGDFDGDGKSDVIGWNGSAWDARISQGTSTAFDFTTVSSNLGALGGGDATALLVGDFDGDGKTDLAARNDNDSAWTIWRSAGILDNDLQFQKITQTSLGADISPSDTHHIADFDGNGKSDVLALVDSEIDAWLSQGLDDVMPFQLVDNNLLQFGGQPLIQNLIGDFDGDGKTDYASLDSSGNGWVFQVAGLARTRTVDDDYCDICSNDGYTWGIDAFATLQDALDASWYADTIVVQAGVYSGATIHAGQDYLTLQGVDPDAVFLDADGDVGITILPADETTETYPNIFGVTLQNFTIRHASTGIEVNYGGQASEAPDVSDERNVQVKNVLIYQDLADSTAIKALESALWLQHATLVSNASDVTLVHNTPGVIIDNHIFLQNNLVVALPNAAPLPGWWIDDEDQSPALDTHNGFASENGEKSDWSVAPSSHPLTLMTLDQAQFLDMDDQLFRIESDSVARGQASDGKDQGYYTYHEPVYVDATYCETCVNDGHSWGVDAYNNIQDAIATGAQKVLIDPGLYRERISLVNGVSLLGSGAGLTVLAPPDDEGGYLVNVGNAKETTLALVTLSGEDSGDGITVSGEGSFELERTIVRSTGTALNVSGEEATATLVNNTLVSNDNGVVASECGNLDIRNTILAFHQNTALTYQSEGCSRTQTLLHTYNDYWRNISDLIIDGGAIDDPGSGEIFADPRFTNPDNHDYRPQSDSPVVDTGDPSDPAPPSSGVRVDMGYAQSAEAAVYASKDYCEQCLNDGLEWQVTAFDSIQDAIDNVPDIEGVWTVGVDGDDTGSIVYQENVQLKSGIRLVGSGAETTIVDAGGRDSAMTLDGITDVEIMGFTLTNSGEDATDAGVEVMGASSHITLTYNIIGGASPNTSNLGNGNAGVIFSDDSTGALLFNSIVINYGTGVVVQDEHSWLDASYNIIALNDIGFDNSQGGQIFNDYNLLYNTDTDWCGSCSNYQGSVAQASNEMVTDPLFVDASYGDFELTSSSPAVDVVPNPLWPDVPTGGGDKGDLGYRELQAVPIALLLGKEGESCSLGNAGVASVDVGLVYVSDSSLPITDTAPSTWQATSLSTVGETGSYWTADITPASGEGLYRLYSKPTDEVGNVSTQVSDWFRNDFLADSSPPLANLLQPDADSTITAPAIQLVAAVTDTLQAGGSTFDTLEQVWFLVDGAEITPTVTSEGLYSAVVSLSNGTHTLRAQATDQAGNLGQSDQVQVVVVTTANEAMLASPVSGSAVLSPTLDIEGFVHFQDTAGTGQVEVLVDGSSQGTATLVDASAQSTSWRKTITLGQEGTHALTLKASRTQGSLLSQVVTSTLLLDTLPPDITITTPSGVVTDTITFTGTASDDGSGLTTVEVSLDGGRTWQAATLNSNDTWQLDWQATQADDYVTYPLLARATDQAGNTDTASTSLTIDNTHPTGLTPITFDPAEGSHLDNATALQISWSSISDGSGSPGILVAVDTISNTMPSESVTGDSYTASLSGTGNWYAHLAVTDPSGNIYLRHYGPWIVDGALSATATFSKAIILDGVVDIDHGEWLPDSEHLDDDTRPSRRQDLYATWDDSFLYVAWQGALWQLDGTLAVYLDVSDGGATDVLSYQDNPLGKAPLPFLADYAIAISGPNQGGLWRYLPDSGWQPENSDLLSFALSNSGGTELRLDRGPEWSGPVRMLALAVHDSGVIWSVFPTGNSLDGPANSSFNWDNLASNTIPNEGQPTAHNIQLSIGSPLGSSGYLGPESELIYTIHVFNADNKALTGASIDLWTDDVLSFRRVSGADCLDCPTDGKHWRLQLPDLQAGETHLVTVWSQLAAALGDIQQVTTTVQLDPGDGSVQMDSYSHQLDARPPTVSITSPTLRVLAPDQQVIGGIASDEGIGVAEVRWRMAGELDWQLADGTRVWTFSVDVPSSGTLNLEVQALDAHGHASEVVTAEFIVDDVAPTTSFSPPSLLGGSYAHLTGTAFDTYPAAGTIAAIELQVDEGGPWSTISGRFPKDATGVYNWHFVWTLPAEEGSVHQLRARALDTAGNVGPATAWQRIVVDSVPPQTLIAGPETGDLVGRTRTIVWGIARDGWGIAAVQVSVHGSPWQQALLGEDAARLLAQDSFFPQNLEMSELWALPVSLPSRSNKVVIQARSIDLAGNLESPAQKVRVIAANNHLWLPLIANK
ncbi:MAG: hypothetical protein GY759_16645 [Chloroflexi bacterium]|nr:hypothetical protein [Chloroflexota bacterium]